VSRVSEKLIGVLPPAFLMLLLINSAFLGVVLWFLDAQIDQRTHLVERIIDHCYELERMAPLAK